MHAKKLWLKLYLPRPEEILYPVSYTSTGMPPVPLSELVTKGGAHSVCMCTNRCLVFSDMSGPFKAFFTLILLKMSSDLMYSTSRAVTYNRSFSCKP